MEPWVNIKPSKCSPNSCGNEGHWVVRKLWSISTYFPPPMAIRAIDDVLTYMSMRHPEITIPLANNQATIHHCKTDLPNFARDIHKRNSQTTDRKVARRD
eukprot:4673713-Amphidinium_carterae.1